MASSCRQLFFQSSRQVSRHPNPEDALERDNLDTVDGAADSKAAKEAFNQQHQQLKLSHSAESKGDGDHEGDAPTGKVKTPFNAQSSLSGQQKLPRFPKKLDSRLNQV